MPRIILVPLVLLLVLVVGLALFLPFLLDKDQLLQLAMDELYEQTGARLTVEGETSLSLFPILGVELGDAAVTLPKKSQPALRVRLLQIGVQAWPLLSGRVEVDSVNLDGVQALIESEDEQGAAGKARQPGTAPSDAEATMALPLALQVRRLTITAARIELRNPRAAQATVINLHSLEAQNLNLAGRDIPVQLHLEIPGARPVDAQLQGTLRVDQNTQRASLAELELLLTGVTSAPLNAIIEGDILLQQRSANLRLQLEAGDTRGQGTLRYAEFASPRIDAELTLNRLDPVLLALAGPDAAATNAKDEGTDGDEPLPLDALRTIDTRAVLHIAEAQLQAHTLTAVELHVRAAEGVVAIESLSGELYGGRLQANARLDGRRDSATLTTAGSLRALDIADALAASGSSTQLTGTASLAWELASRGSTRNQLVSALTGPVTLTTEAVELQGTSVENMLCKAVALTNGEALSATFPDSTRFETLGANVQLADGKALLQPLHADLGEIDLTGTGKLDLLTRDFKASFKARLSPELENLDHACRVSKRLLEIDWPVNCKGNTASDPDQWCKVDAEEIIQDLAVQEGRNKLQKKAGKLFDKLFR